ncbi:MAG: LacI family DNA-binding transcriptional regulator [Ardenticatenaceae bacterium]|nr:LacI family DNA-binding transcriptional regulator [Ardenticatenaceae bacterium]
MASITIRDVAKKAGVGVGTVSRVLNRNPAVREATRLKVLAAIEELEFTPSPIARRLSLGKTMTVAVIAPFFVRPSYVERFRGLDKVLSESEYDFVLYNVETTSRRDHYFRELARSDKVDGLIIMSLTPTDNTVESFLNAGIPTVLVDAAHPRLSHIIIDDCEGGYNATKHLIDLGHRKIAYISDHMHENPLTFNQSWIAIEVIVRRWKRPTSLSAPTTIARANCRAVSPKNWPRNSLLCPTHQRPYLPTQTHRPLVF